MRKQLLAAATYWSPNCRSCVVCGRSPPTTPTAWRKRLGYCYFHSTSCSLLAGCGIDVVTMSHALLPTEISTYIHTYILQYICYLIAANLSKYPTLIEPVPYWTSTYSSIHIYITCMHAYMHTCILIALTFKQVRVEDDMMKWTRCERNYLMFASS